MHRICAFIAALTLFIVISGALPAHAYYDDIKRSRPEKKHPREKEEPAEEPSELCYGLDYRTRFSKKNIAEVDFYGGNYLGDYSQNTWAAGARAYYHLNHVFAFGAEYLYSHLRVDTASSLGQILRNKDQHVVDAQMMINNEILFAAGKHQIPMDLYLTIGGGALRINDQWKWTAVIGGGLKVYFDPTWFALRIDVNSYIHPTPTANGSQLSGDVSFLFGFALHFPHRPPEGVTP